MPLLIQPEVPVDGLLLVRQVIASQVADRLDVYPATLDVGRHQRVVGGRVQQVRRRHLDGVLRGQVVQRFVERRGHRATSPDLVGVRHHRQLLAVVPPGSIPIALGGERDRVGPAYHHPPRHTRLHLLSCLDLLAHFVGGVREGLKTAEGLAHFLEELVTPGAGGFRGQLLWSPCAAGGEEDGSNSEEQEPADHGRLPLCMFHHR